MPSTTHDRFAKLSRGVEIALLVFALLTIGVAASPVAAQPTEEAPSAEVPAEPTVELEEEFEPLLPDFSIVPPDLPGSVVDEEVDFENPLGLDLEQDPIESSRDLLARAGVDESHLRFLIDGRPLHIDEQETLNRIQYNLRRYTLANLDLWQLKGTTLDDISADPAKYRAAIVRVMGRVRAIHRRELSPALAERFLFEEYYEVELESYEHNRLVRIFAREIPAAWQPLVDSREPLDEQASAVAMFLKAGTPATGEGDEPDSTVLYFAARRIAWHPDQVNEELGVIPDHLKLSKMGMDVGLFADVRDREALLAEDRECFYQLLFAVRNATPERLGPQELTPHDFEAWIMQPKDQHGKLITIRGICRQASEVIVDDVDIQSRFGIHHYYELVIFVPLETNIKFTRQDGEPAVFSEYPFVVCVRQLPEGMPTGPDIRELVQVTGVYCKLYGYQTERFTHQSRYVQTSPLLVGLKAEWINDKPVRNPWIGPLIGGLFVVALAGVWLGLWQYGRGDRAFQKQVLSKRRQEPDKSLNDLGIEATGEPDFSHLDD